MKTKQILYQFEIAVKQLPELSASNYYYYEVMK
jgi:hypothetical protein